MIDSSECAEFAFKQMQLLLNIGFRNTLNRKLNGRIANRVCDPDSAEVSMSDNFCDLVMVPVSITVVVETVDCFKGADFLLNC